MVHSILGAILYTLHLLEKSSYFAPSKRVKKKKKKITKEMTLVHDEQCWLGLTAWEISNLIGLLSFPELMDMVVSQDHWVSISAGWAPVNNLSLP